MCFRYRMYCIENETIPTFALSEAANGTHLRLVHSGFVPPKNDTASRNMSGGWKQVVGRIGAMSGA